MTMERIHISRNLTYLAPTKEIHLIPANSMLKSPGQMATTRSASRRRYWRATCISPSATSSAGSDNYFDLLPGETVRSRERAMPHWLELKAQCTSSHLPMRLLCSRQPATVICSTLSKSQKAGREVRPFAQCAAQALRTRRRPGRKCVTRRGEDPAREP